jgi:hypothetical protein
VRSTTVSFCCLYLDLSRQFLSINFAEPIIVGVDNPVRAIPAVVGAGHVNITSSQSPVVFPVKNTYLFEPIGSPVNDPTGRAYRISLAGINGLGIK